MVRRADAWFSAATSIKRAAKPEQIHTGPGHLHVCNHYLTSPVSMPLKTNEATLNNGRNMKTPVR